MSMEVKRLPFSKVTQELFDMANEMREGMHKSFVANNRHPKPDIIELHRQQVEENMRGVMAQLHKAISVECPAVIISFSDDELKVREISPEELFIQPIKGQDNE